MMIDKSDAIILIKEQIIDQGCERDSFAELRLFQPHLYQWIKFFNIKEGELK